MAAPSATARVSLRPVTTGDQPFLAALYASTRPDLARLPLGDEQREVLVRMQFRAQDIYYRQHHPDASFDVVEVDRRPAGRLYVDRGADDLRVIDVSLLPEHRAHGIGSGLLRALQDEAAAHGRSVSLHVAIDNRAVRLYERLGFRMVEDLGVYRRMGWSAP